MINTRPKSIVYERGCSDSENAMRISLMKRYTFPVSFRSFKRIGNLGRGGVVVMTA